MITSRSFPNFFFYATFLGILATHEEDHVAQKSRMLSFLYLKSLRLTLAFPWVCLAKFIGASHMDSGSGERLSRLYRNNPVGPIAPTIVGILGYY